MASTTQRAGGEGDRNFSVSLGVQSEGGCAGRRSKARVDQPVQLVGVRANLVLSLGRRGLAGLVRGQRRAGQGGRGERQAGGAAENGAADTAAEGHSCG